MAVIVPTMKALGGGAAEVVWTLAADGDEGAPVALSRYRDKTVTIEGTATTFALKGSNAQDASNPRTLEDVDATTAITAAGVYVIKENPLLVWPILTTGSAVSVRMVCR